MLKHPLFRNVKAFDGGNGCYRSQMTLTSGAKMLSLWSDGTPFAAEKQKPARGEPFQLLSGDSLCLVAAGKSKPGVMMVLNFYPVSSSDNVRCCCLSQRERADRVCLTRRISTGARLQMAVF